MRLSIVAITALLPLVACGTHDSGPGIAGTGSATSRSYAVDGFTAIGLAGPDDVVVSVGPGFSVRAEGDAKVLDRLRVERDGTTLTIGRRHDGLFGGMGTGSAKIYVTMPAITGANLAGSGDLSIDRASGDALDLSLAGSGDLSVAALAVKAADIAISGSGKVTLAGEAEQVRAKIAGSGDVKGGELTARGADIAIAGSGGVKLAVKGHATVKVTGSGDVDLGREATCDSKMMGSGSVRCGR